MRAHVSAVSFRTHGALAVRTEAEKRDLVHGHPRGQHPVTEFRVRQGRQLRAAENPYPVVSHVFIGKRPHGQTAALRNLHPHVSHVVTGKRPHGQTAAGPR